MIQPAFLLPLHRQFSKTLNTVTLNLFECKMVYLTQKFMYLFGSISVLILNTYLLGNECRRYGYLLLTNAEY